MFVSISQPAFLRRHRLTSNGMKGVPRNAEATRERILEAATAEFAAFGIAGARVERIAEASQSNKSLIYQYFQSKERLFELVLDRRVQAVYEAVPFTPDDLPGYAGALFDFSMENPDLMRLFAWQGLETAAPIPSKVVSTTEKLASVASAQARGLVTNDFTPEFVLTLMMLIATGWTAVTPFGRYLDPDYRAKTAEYREMVKRLVGLLARPS